MKKINEEDLKSVLNSLAGSIQNENIELFEKLYEGKDAKIKNPDDFFYKYCHKTYKQMKLF